MIAIGWPETRANAFHRKNRFRLPRGSLEGGTRCPPNPAKALTAQRLRLLIAAPAAFPRQTSYLLVEASLSPLDEPLFAPDVSAFVLQPPLPWQEFFPLHPLSPALQPPWPLHEFWPLQLCWPVVDLSDAWPLLSSLIDEEPELVPSAWARRAKDPV